MLEQVLTIIVESHLDIGFRSRVVQVLKLEITLTVKDTCLYSRSHVLFLVIRNALIVKQNNIYLHLLY